MNDLLFFINKHMVGSHSNNVSVFPLYDQCNVCKYKTGTSRYMQHFYNCIHKKPQTTFPLHYEQRIIPQECFRTDDVLFIHMREYGIVDATTDKKIIGSGSASTCFILCMRDRETTKTMVAHIDAMTLFPLDIFRNHFRHEVTDVYIVGGDETSMSNLHDLVVLLNFYNYTLLFAHVIEDNTNQFYINSVSGSIYLDTIDNYKHSAIIIKKLLQRNLPFTRTPLYNIDA